MSRRNPLGDIEQVFERMNRELATLGDQIEREFRTDVDVDVIEREDEIVVVADLPGFDTDAIDVSLAGRDLTITAERDTTLETTEGETDEERDVRVHRRERRTESVRRQVRLPEDVVEGETTAEYDQGVLRITLPTPESEDVAERSIEIE
ncbi:MAG: Hsp20/alpha crystallin family protein [Halobaculum sp.]